MKKNKKEKKEYTKPYLEVKKTTINFFKYSESMEQLLAVCSYCIGDTCPPGCSKSCFLGETKILTIKGVKEIKKINDGDIVLSYNIPKKKITKSEVKNVLVHENVPIFLIINKHIKVTPEHRFWVNNNQWKRANEIRIGDYLLNYKGEKVVVISKEYINKKVTVYNLELKGNYHNYFAEEVLVHNWK